MKKKVSNLFAFIICIFISCYNYKVEEKCCSIQNYKIVERNKEPFCTGSRVLHFNTISEEILKKYDGEIIQDITYYPGQYEKKCSLDKVYLADFFIDIQSDTINIIERFDFCENYLIEYYISLKIDDPEIELQHFKNRIKEEIGCKTFDTLKVNERLIRTYDNVIIEMYLSEVHYTPGEQRGFELEVIYKIQPVN